MEKEEKQDKKITDLATIKILSTEPDENTTEFQRKLSSTYWNEKIENNLKNIAKFCRDYKILNIQKSEKYNKKYNILIYCTIFFSPLSGTLLSIGYEELNIAIIVITFITGILSAIIKYSNYEYDSILHKNLAVKFASLETNINRQLSLEKINRINDIKYLDWVSNSYDELFNSMPIGGMLLESFKNEKLEIVISSKEKINQTNLEQIDTMKFSDKKMKYELERYNQNFT
jgi:hypothetical protein